MEMIDFQLNDKFGQDMELIITDICHSVKDGITNSRLAKMDEIKDLEDLIFKRLGMRTKFVINDILAATMPLYANNYHVFADSFWRGNIELPDQTAFLDKINGQTGYVDTKNAKLGGFFSDYRHIVYMNFKDLVKNFKMSPGQITAILLHELGHCFTFCEYSDRLSTNNQIFAGIAKELAKPADKRNAEYIFKELTLLNPNTKREMADKIASGQRIVSTGESFKYAIECVTQQLEDAKYDETQSESLADNFAARFGYGGELVSSLQVLGTHYDENAERRLGFFSAVLAIVISLLVGIAMITTIAGLFYLLVSFFMGTLLLLSSGESGKDYTYDDIKIRYKRIRDQVVHEIKLRKYTVEHAHHLSKQIEFLDKIVKSTGNWRSPLDKLMNKFNPKDILAKRSIERQQLLEDLASNELFIQSLRLQVLSA